MRPEEHRTRIREVRARLGREGPASTRGPERDFATVTLPERDCDLLRDLLISERVSTVVEVGLAYGSSALAVGEALVLSQLVSEGVHADAAFVDGSHRFHEVFVDLYFLRKIVRPGGVIVVDDDWAPSVRTAVRYYERNLGWMTLPEAFAGGTRWTIGREPAAEAVPRCRALRLPEPFEPPFDEFHPF